MFRRIVITLTMLLALPAFANAWFVTASKSGGVAGNRVSPAGQTAVSGFAGTFKNISTIAASSDQVNRVTIDGVAQCNTPATVTLSACSNSTFYPVNYVAGKTYRTLVAYFGTAIVPGANITVRPPVNSTYRVTSPVNGSLTNITKASNRTIAIIPKSGYSVSFVNISSAGAGSGSSACTTSPSAQFLGAKDVVCNNIQGAIAITGTSGVSQTVTVYAGADRTVGAPGQTITLNGSATYTVGTPTYTWNATGPGAVTFGTAYGSNGATPPAQVALPGNYKTFTANAAGTYTVTLTVSGLTGTGSSVLTDTATIVVANATATAVNQCAVCHRSRNAEVFFAYSAGAHKTDNVTCQRCHDPGNSGHYTVATPNCQTSGCHTNAALFTQYSTSAHKTVLAFTCESCHGAGDKHALHSTTCITCHNGTGFTGHANAGSNCLTCHSTSATNNHAVKTVATTTFTNAQCVTCHGSVPGHSAAADSCSQCHGTHRSTTHAVFSLSVCSNCHVTETTVTVAPHYGGTAFLKAQYVSDASLPVTCTNCHGSAANQAILRQYTSSAHGSPLAEAWRHCDWRGGNRSACQRCHAGTAFVAKLGNENSTTNAYQAADVLKPGEVLNCSACHTDAGTGALRTAAESFTINMTNAATATYDVVGASTLCARCHSGRETGASITASTNTTGILGFIDSHYQPAAGTMYNQAGYEYAGQTYDSLGGHKLLGATGQGPCVTCHMSGKNHKLTAASCSTCHDGTTAPAVNAATLKANYDTALDNLKLALAAKGIHYGPVHPFFFTAAYVEGGTNAPVTNWGSAYGAGSWKDTMGAAFNYNMLWSEKGAYAHNYDYAMKLIADSIDFISDGTVAGP